MPMKSAANSGFIVTTPTKRRPCRSGRLTSGISGSWPRKSSPTARATMVRGATTQFIRGRSCPKRRAAKMARTTARAMSSKSIPDQAGAGSISPRFERNPTPARSIAPRGDGRCVRIAYQKMTCRISGTFRNVSTKTVPRMFRMRFEETRMRPTVRPTSVAPASPKSPTKMVFTKPASSIRAYVDRSETSKSAKLIGQPDERSRNPNPVAMPCETRFSRAVSTKVSVRSTATARTPIWIRMPLTRRLRMALSMRFSVACTGPGQRPAPRLASVEHERVEKPAVRPEMVLPARQPVDGIVTDRAVVDLAVVPDRLDHGVDPIVAEAETGAHARADAQQPLDRGRRRVRAHLIHVRLRDPRLFGHEKRRHHPVDHVDEAVVAFTGGDAFGFEGEHGVEDGEVFGIRRVEPRCRKERSEACQRVATPGIEGRAQFLGVVEVQGLVGDAARAHVVGHDALNRGTGVDAEHAALEVGGRGRPDVGPRENVRRPDEVGPRVLQAELGVAAHRPAGDLDDDVDIARLKRRETLRPAYGDDLKRVRAAENRGGERLAHLDVEARPFALIIDFREAEVAAVVAGAEKASALLDHRHRRAGVGLGQRARRQRHRTGQRRCADKVECFLNHVGSPVGKGLSPRHGRLFLRTPPEAASGSVSAATLIPVVPLRPRNDSSRSRNPSVCIRARRSASSASCAAMASTMT